MEAEVNQSGLVGKVLRCSVDTRRWANPMAALLTCVLGRKGLRGTGVREEAYRKKPWKLRQGGSRGGGHPRMKQDRREAGVLIRQEKNLDSRGEGALASLVEV